MSMSDAYRVPLRFKISRPILKATFRLLFRILGRVTITGRENIPRGRPCLVAMNHVSIFAPPLAGSFWPGSLEIIGAIDVFDKPFQGQILRAYGVIPVHRGDYDRPLLNKMISILRAGYPILISPEGSRSHVPGLQPAKQGLAYLVEKTGVPVIPVALVGTTEDFWQRAKRGERPQLEIRIGKLIQLPEIDGKGIERHDARQNNADLVMRYIAGLLPVEYRGAYAESAIFPS
jgi:1-acyl-sn-glycerol-3-phosphate acyltransferase